MSDKFLFCGTGAANFTVPAEGEEFRKFTHSLLNGIILFDMGANAYKFEDESTVKQRFANVKYVLFTHSHGDHFNADKLLRLASDNGGITVFMDSGCSSLIPESPLIKVVPVHTDDVFEIEGYSIRVLPSNHTTGRKEESTHHYTVTTPSGKSVFYALDSAWLLTDETNYLMKNPCDLAVLDCTLGRIRGDYRVFEHNTIFMLEIMVETLRNAKMVKPDGLIYGTHLAKDLHEPQDKVEADLASFGMHAAYDGLEIEF